MVALIEIRGRKVHVDVRAELEQFHWIRPRWTHEKLIAASPFRYNDSTPSFYVWLTDNPTFRAKAGDWGDSGGDGEYRRGGFVKLLAFLREETEEETEEYLLATYASDWSREECITLHVPTLRLPTVRKALDERMLESYRYRHPYLERRGISEAVQRLCNVGYDRERNAITIPWYTADGRLANVMYRRVDSKIFWYAKDGWPIRGLIYGMNIVYTRKIKRAVLVEAPIDAMYIMTAGIPAIAVGGASFNEAKRDVIVRSPLEEIVIMADHDKAGQAMKRKVIEMLSPYMTVRVAGYPKRFKDPNEIGDLEKIREYIENSRIVRIGNVNIFKWKIV